MAAIAMERRRYTLDAFLALAEELELAAHASPDDPHMRAAMAVPHYLGDARLAGYGREGNDRTVAPDFRIPDIPVEHAYKPDAFFVARDGRAILAHSDTPSVVGAPDIVLEVLSPTTARFGRPPRGKKFRAYHQYGVRYYWLADTARRTVSAFERQGERLVETAVLRPGDTLRCPLLPELGMPVGQAFGLV